MLESPIVGHVMVATITHGYHDTSGGQIMDLYLSNYYLLDSSRLGTEQRNPLSMPFVSSYSLISSPRSPYRQIHEVLFS